MSQFRFITSMSLVSIVLVACGEGTLNSQEEEFDTQIPVNPLNFIPEIPQIRWSLISYTIDDQEIVVESIQPDPNWLSNDFLTDTLFSPDMNIAGVMDCQIFQYEYEFTSPSTIRLGVGEAIELLSDCEINTPEGLLRSVFADFENVIAEGRDDRTIDVTNGNGTLITLEAIEVE